MAKTAPYQLRNTDVRVNSICPGLIQTGMTLPTFDYAASRGTSSKIGQLNALGRYAVAEGQSGVIYRGIHSSYLRNSAEVANLALFLASGAYSLISSPSRWTDGLSGGNR